MVADGKVRIVIEDNAKKSASNFNTLDKSVNKLRTDSNKLDAQVKSNRAGFNRMSTASNGLKLALSGVAIAGVGLVTAKLKGLGNELIDAASEAEETANKFNVTFASVKSDANSLASEIAQSYGLAGDESKKLLSNTGDLLTGFGFTGEQALDLAEGVNRLAVDLASFTNLEGGATRASDALTKALLGERESVKSLGIAILDSDVNAKVKAMEVAGKFTNETERQKKAIATLEIAYQQSKNAIGDFARSQESYANQTRITEATVRDLKVALGEELLPEITAMRTQFNEFLTRETPTMIKDFKMIVSTSKEVIKAFSDIGSVVGSIIPEGVSFSKILFTINYNLQRTALYAQKALTPLKTLFSSDMTFKDAGGEIDKINAKLRGLDSEFENMFMGGGETKLVFDNFGTAVENTTAKTKELKGTLQNVATTNKQNTEEVIKLNSEYTEAGSKITEVNNSLNTQSGAFEELTAKASALKTELYNIAAADIVDMDKFTTAKAEYDALNEKISEVENTVNKTVENTETKTVSWADKIKSFSSSISSALTTPLSEGETAFDRFGDVAESVLSQILAKALELAVITPILNALTGGTGGVIASFMSSVFGSAKGNVFQGGAPVQQYANGGVVSKLSYFPMANGGVGSMAEGNKPEAIMPLSRGTDGKLGVKAETSGGGTVVNIINQSQSQIETREKQDGTMDVFIKKVNKALESPRTSNGFSTASSRQQTKGVQAV